MILTTGKRMLKTSDIRLLRKFAWNFGVKGILSVQRFKRRLRKGVTFPPFLYISITNTCNLRCQGCWVDVSHPAQRISFEEMDRLIENAKSHGNSFFGILGGEPFLHPDLMRILRAHPDCYFQIFTNGQFITDSIADELRDVGNATPLISVEGTETVSDIRRGRRDVLRKTTNGIDACVRHRLITGVASSICRNNFDDLVNESWVDGMIERGVHYIWFHTYRPVGPDAAPELALTPEQVVAVRRFGVEMRRSKPVGFVDAYWDDRGEALCPAATGISHHVGPGGHLEPCPIIQFASESIRDNDGDLFKTMTESRLLEDFRRTAADATRGCIVLERPDLLEQVLQRNGAQDTTLRGTAASELAQRTPLGSQHQPGQVIPEDHWAYRFAKKNWFFGFGAYS